ncbi:hypothetical protein QQ045_004270 [Rhodiola kirilowii]
MGRRRRISAPDGDVSNLAEPICILHSSNDEAKMAGGRSDLVELNGIDLNLSTSKHNVSDTVDKVKKKKKKKGSIDNRTSDVGESLVTNLMDDESLNTDPAKEVELPLQSSAESDQPDNLVLRKLLRGPRYFDPPDYSWGNCYNCGEQGHKTIDCTVEKKKKPCFYCGSIEHTFKKCTKGLDCFICKTGGHKAKDCPEKNIYIKNGSISDKICLRCGDYGHDMFSCKSGYISDDLQAIQCYVCSGFGHLCCYNSTDHVSKGVSCYKCGGLGHTGLACARLVEESAGTSTPTLCYNCGQGGHFARECPHPLKACQKSHLDTVNRASSSCHSCGMEGHFLRNCPSSLKARSRLNGEYHGGRLSNLCRNCGVKGHFARECPNSFMATKSSNRDTSRKNQKIRFDEDGVATFSKQRRGEWITEDPTESPISYRKTTSSKKRGRWITDDPPESPHSYWKAIKDSEQSPVTSTKSKHKIHHSNSGGSNSFGRGALDPQGSTQSYYQRFPSSRFYNYSYNSNSKSKSNDWW